MWETIQILRVLEGLAVPPDAFLVTVYIEALYSSIPHNLGLFLVSQNGARSDHRMNLFILELLKHFLHNNILKFGNKYYIKKQGAAMGARCAPNYANPIGEGGW